MKNPSKRSTLFRSVNLLLLLMALLSAGCGYRIGTGVLTQRYKTLSVPYAKGDVHGILTDALVEQISKSGGFSYRRDGGELVLEVELLDTDEENIGFAYDCDKKGERERSTIPTETRIMAIAMVQLVESCSGKVVYGPVKMEAAVEFDHKYYFGKEDINQISLGQLTDIDTARDAVRGPLFETLARKIARAIIHYW